MSGGSPGLRAFTSTFIDEGCSDGWRAPDHRLSERNSAGQDKGVAKKTCNRCVCFHGRGHDSRPNGVGRRTSSGDSERCRARCFKQHQCNCLTSMLNSWQSSSGRVPAMPVVARCFNHDGGLPLEQKVAVEVVLANSRQCKCDSRSSLDTACVLAMGVHWNLCKKPTRW